MGEQAKPSPIAASSTTLGQIDPYFIKLLKIAYEKEKSDETPTGSTPDKISPNLADTESEEAVRDTEEASAQADQSGEGIDSVVDEETDESDPSFRSEAELASPPSSEAQDGKAKFDLAAARWTMYRRIIPVFRWLHDVTTEFLSEESILSYISMTGIEGAGLSAFYSAMSTFLSCPPNVTLRRVHPFLEKRLPVIQPRIDSTHIDLTIPWSPPTDEEIKRRVEGLFYSAKLNDDDVKVTPTSSPARNMKGSIVPKVRTKSFLPPRFCQLHQHVLKTLRFDQSLVNNPLIRFSSRKPASNSAGQSDQKEAGVDEKQDEKQSESDSSGAEKSSSSNPAATQPADEQRDRWLNLLHAKCMAFVGDKMDTMFKVALGIELAPECPSEIRLVARWLLTSNLAQGHRLDSTGYLDGLIAEHDGGSNEELLVFLGHELGLSYKPVVAQEQPDTAQEQREQPAPPQEPLEQPEQVIEQPEMAEPAQEPTPAQEPVPYGVTLLTEWYRSNWTKAFMAVVNGYPKVPNDRVSDNGGVVENIEREHSEPNEDPDKTTLGIPEDNSDQAEEENLDAETTLVEISEDACPSLKRAAATLDAESEDTNDTDRPHKRVKDTATQIPSVSDPPPVAESSRKRRREDDNDYALQPPSNRQRTTISELPPGLPAASGTAEGRSFDRAKSSKNVSEFLSRQRVQAAPSHVHAHAYAPSLPPTLFTPILAPQPAGISPPPVPSLPSIALNPIPTFTTPTPTPSRAFRNGIRFPVVNIRTPLQNITNLPTS